MRPSRSAFLHREGGTLVPAGSGRGPAAGSDDAVGWFVPCPIGPGSGPAGARDGPMLVAV
jgi:hypothetical protein